MSGKRRWLAGLILVAAVLSGVRAQQTVQEALALDIEQMRSGGPFLVGQSRIAAVLVIGELFTLRRFEPAWTGDSRNLDQLTSLIDEAASLGLNAEDYHAEALARLRAEVESSSEADPALLADLELLATDALVRLAYHRYFGKVDAVSLDNNWNIERSLGGDDPAGAINRALNEHSLVTRVHGLDPSLFFYQNLKDALASYRAIASRGGWDPVAEGATLRLGDESPRVVQLRRRLAVTADLPAGTSVDSERFDDVVDAAVKHFQSRHHLTADGIVGRGTLAQLNVPVERRIDQIRVNLERARWVAGEANPEGRAVVVNIAGFEVFVFEGTERVWETRAQVGKEYRKTPIFKGTMTYIQFNPTWTVPPTIRQKDILPKVLADPGYLEVHGFDILDGAGNVVDPRGLDWSRYTPTRFPYTLRQRPGPNNAMGLVKFMFPNPHFVFLHDTPSRSGFGAEVRTFSSGCIRVENPLDLAELLLADPAKWSRARIDELIESGRTTNVFLEQPLPVYLMYWTANLDEEGRVVFWRDVYERDEPILKQLNADFQVSQRILAPIQQRMQQSGVRPRMLHE